MASLSITVIDSELKMPLDISVESKDYVEILSSYKVGPLKLLAILMQEVDLEEEGEESIRVWRLEDGRLIMNGDVHEFIVGKDFPGGRVSSNQDSGRKDKSHNIYPTEPRDVQETDL